MYQYEKGSFSEWKISVVDEVSFLVLVAAEEFTILMCTPVKLRDLALGCLAFKHQIESYADVKEIEIDE